MVISQRQVQCWSAGRREVRIDDLAVEEPLEIRADETSLAVLMRTPGHDLELVRGLLHSEGVLRGEAYRLFKDGENTAVLQFPERLVTERWSSRNVISSSACGVCGASAIAVLDELATPVRSGLQWSAQQVFKAPKTLRSQQKSFSRTGALHAAGLFDEEGQMVVCREDVGRHNAVDKVIGWGLQQCQDDFSEHVLVVSGRLSYEIVHKAAVAGLPLVVAVSAPSSLAVDLAERWRITLAGFVRGERFNVYSHPQRIVNTEPCVDPLDCGTC